MEARVPPGASRERRGISDGLVLRSDGPDAGDLPSILVDEQAVPVFS
jgi:hypothetical protein